ncbi:MAG TPA: hypothetical protein PKI93_07760 [Alphaproteobacteria bacterium]|nr:hypothetical protein [Alphaproteobacteria bacterium]HNS44825.1 hypothetical protein [Alphaproteobacteria bacterium]
MKSLAKPSLVMLFGLSLQACDIKLKTTHIDVTQREITEATLKTDQLNENLQQQLKALQAKSLDGNGKLFWNNEASLGLYYSRGLKVSPAKVEISTDCDKYFTMGGGCEIEKDYARAKGGGVTYAGDKKIIVVSADLGLKVCDDRLDASIEAIFGNNACSDFNVRSLSASQQEFNLLNDAIGNRRNLPLTKDVRDKAWDYTKRMP